MPTWSRKGPRIGRSASASSSTETLPSFGLDVQLRKVRRLGRADRQPHERGENGRIGLLGRERAVAVAVEAGVDRSDGFDPDASNGRPCDSDPQADEDRAVLGEEDRAARGTVHDQPVPLLALRGGEGQHQRAADVPVIRALP